MIKKEFDKLLKIKTPYEIIKMHYKSIINLTSAQLNYLIKIPNEDRKRVKNDK